jgi:hypothetical protein
MTGNLTRNCVLASCQTVFASTVSIRAMNRDASGSAFAGVAGVRGAATLAAIAAVCAGLGACGSSTTSSTPATATKDLDISRVERAIERSIMSQRHLKSKVLCPEAVLQKPGKFACVATTYSVKKPHRKIKTPFVVTIHNSSGYVTYIGRQAGR